MGCNIQHRHNIQYIG
uniref:Uncharacterized protein n=1 Tax=Rhizophora mucronata TaxID=61149 RepID=A0A2P2MSW3_RHIMU